MFYERFRVATPLTDLTQTWLHSPGVPTEINNLNIIKHIESNHYYIDVLDAFKEITDLIQTFKKKRLKECSLEQDLRWKVSTVVLSLLNLHFSPGILTRCLCCSTAS